MRRFLAEFLQDPRVVALPRLIWLPILHGVVLRTRPSRSARKYAAIWTPEGSPLAVHTRKQAELLRTALPGSRVEFAMRYGEPSIGAGLKTLSACSRIAVLPLYPQYSRSATASVRDAIGPGVPMLEQFHDHPRYIEALMALVERHWQAHGRAQLLVMSFHGLPQQAIDRGDPYERQCYATANALASRLGLRPGQFIVTFQSRFGAARWLRPYTEPALVELARNGSTRADVICPGFVSDCLETLEEIGIAAREAFLRAGGSEFHLLPCLNESPEWIAALAEITRTLEMHPAGPI